MARWKMRSKECEIHRLESGLVRARWAKEHTYSYRTRGAQVRFLNGLLRAHECASETDVITRKLTPNWFVYIQVLPAECFSLKSPIQ